MNSANKPDKEERNIEMQMYVRQFVNLNLGAKLHSIIKNLKKNYFHWIGN